MAADAAMAWSGCHDMADTRTCLCRLVTASADLGEQQLSDLCECAPVLLSRPSISVSSADSSRAAASEPRPEASAAPSARLPTPASHTFHAV